MWGPPVLAGVCRPTISLLSTGAQAGHANGLLGRDGAQGQSSIGVGCCGAVGLLLHARPRRSDTSFGNLRAGMTKGVH